MRQGQRTFGLPFGPRAVIDFEANAARIDVVPCEGGEDPRIECKRPGAPLDIKQVGEALKVRLAGNWESGPILDTGVAVIDTAVQSFLGGGFGGEFMLYLPGTVRARIGCNMGQARIRGLDCCDLEVVTNAGQVELEDCRGRFKLAAKAGQIVGKRLGGTFAVQSGAGEAVLDIVQLDPGVHTVHSTMGAVKLWLAPGLEVRVESRTVMGSTRTRYPSKPDAAAVLKVEAELGAVKVREGSPYVDPRHGDWPDWRKVWLSDVGPVATPQPDELRRILEMVQQQKLTPEEAERLIAAL